MKKTTATCTGILAAVIAAAALLALADTSYADRGRDRDRTPTPSVRDGHRDRDADRFRDRGDRDRDRSRIWQDRPWDRYDRDYGFRRLPISQVRVYLIPVRVLTTVRVLGQGSYVFLGFGPCW
jgi:hypothetical protein